MSKSKRPTKAELERKLIETSAQLVHVYHFADATIGKAGDCLTGSGVLLQLHALGGREIISPIVIRDGLSADTIAALKRDIARSYAGATIFKPKGVQA